MPVGLFSNPTVNRSAPNLGDPNSIVCGRLDHPSWGWYPHTPIVRSIAGDAAAFPFANARTLTLVNADGQAAPDAGPQYAVTLPSDAGTSWQIHLDDVSVSSGSTGPAALQVWDSTGTSLVSSTAFTATTLVANVRTTSITLAAGTEYILRVNCNPSGGGQATFLCGRLRFVPISPTNAAYSNPYSATVGAGFVYYPIDSTRLQDNDLVRGYDNQRFQRRSEGAHADFSTNAVWIIVGVYDNIGDYIGAPRDDISVFVDGVPLDPPLTPTIAATSYLTINLPSPVVTTQMHDVSIVDGPQAITGLPSPVNENRGSFPSFVIAPAGAAIQFSTVPTTEVEVIVADSKGAWFYSTIPGRDSFAASARQRGVRIVMEAEGGGSVSASAGTTVSPTAPGVVSFARRICTHAPSKVHFMLGRNDFTANTFGSTASLMEQIRNCIRAIHAEYPSAIVAICTWTHEATEADQDVTWEAARATMRAMAYSPEFAPYCVLEDLACLWSVAEAAVGVRTSDGVHPNDAGQQEIAQVFAGGQWPWTPNRIAGLIGWYEPDAPGALVGVAMSTPSSSGTAPPTLTLSGTPNTGIGALRIECTLGGARGAAQFRWSAGTQDAGGRHWDATGVTTAASNVLGSTGLTAAWSNATFVNDNVWTSQLVVSQETDLSGSSNHMVQATAGARPKWTASADTQTPIIGSQVVAPGLSFTPTQWLHKASLSVAPPWSIVCVAKASTTSGLPAIWGAGANATAPLLYITGAAAIQANDGTHNINQSSGATPLAQSVYTVVATGTSSSLLRVNGTQTSGTLGTTITDLAIGHDATNLLDLTGTVSLFLLYSAALSASDIVQAEAYAIAKYQAGGPTVGAGALAAKVEFAAAASLTAQTTQYIPPGNGATTSSSDTTLGFMCSGSGSLSRMSVQFTGAVGNAGGQTATFQLYKNGSAITGAVSTALATTAGTKTASVTFAPIGYTDGDIITASVAIGVGALTTALADVMVSAQ